MHTNNSDWKRRYDYEVISATLKVREFFLRMVVKNIYENIGQVLSLACMQLSMVKSNFTIASLEDIDASKNLLSQSVKELRNMCKKFYPDVYLVKELEWIDLLNYMISTLELRIERKITMTGKSKEIPADLKLIIFRMLQEILISIKSCNCKLVGMHVYHLTDQLRIAITYADVPKNWKESHHEKREKDIYRSLSERALLLNGTFHLQTVKKGVDRMELIISTTITDYVYNC